MLHEELIHHEQEHSGGTSGLWADRKGALKTKPHGPSAPAVTSPCPPRAADMDLHRNHLRER